MSNASLSTFYPAVEITRKRYDSLLHSIKKFVAIACIASGLMAVSSCTTIPPADFPDISPTYIPNEVLGTPSEGVDVRLAVIDNRSDNAFIYPPPHLAPQLEILKIPKQIPDQDPSYFFHLRTPAAEVVRDALEKALIRRSYSIRENASITLEVYLNDFSMTFRSTDTWASVISSSPRVALQVRVRAAQGVRVMEEVAEEGPSTVCSGLNLVAFRQRPTDFDLYLPGASDSSRAWVPVGERTLSEHMSRAIDRALDDPELVTAIAKATSIQPTTTAKIEEKTEELLSTRSPSIWTPGARRCLWVLAVGVGQYKDPQIPALPFARKDAERVRNWFVNLGVEDMTRNNAHVLFNEQAIRENLLAQIDWLRRKALPEDAVFVYFAGHGAPELAADGTSVDAKYLVLYDTNPSQLYETGFPLDELTRRLDGVKAKTQVVILEACYAGPVGQEILKKTPTADLEIRPRSIQKLGEKRGRVILSASSGRQMAIGSDVIGGSLFTHHLLNAWEDGNTRLLSDGFDEARYQVRRASNDLGSFQEPVKFGDQNVDVLLKVK